MPKNQVNDLITDQEMAFARLILSGTMTDRDAAKAAGLHPASAAHIKSRPRVRDYMLAHRAVVEQQLVQQQTESHRQHDLSRQRTLARLWEIANLSPEMTRGSVTSQVKALTMIVAIEELIPNARPSAPKRLPAAPAFTPGDETSLIQDSDPETVQPTPTSPAQASPLPLPTTQPARSGFDNWPLKS